MVIEAHIAYPVNRRLNILHGVPGKLAVGNKRQLLMKLIVQLEEIIELLAFNRRALLIKILLKLINLLAVDHSRRPTHHRTLDGLAHEAAVADLRQGYFIDVAAALRTDLDQAIFRQLNKRLAHRLTGNVKAHGDFLFRQRRAGWDQTMDDIPAEDPINLLIYRLCWIEL
ncbi:Uncharacterised protein [Raoultella terrigena]|uniref:Uncharacterized protein n=1 Tax=Raoultella terrigena TaxID=577 RepID=A0A485BIF9_RAOTE|nr:Uncharacterised protein [Raoultella terrigena]